MCSLVKKEKKKKKVELSPKNFHLEPHTIQLREVDTWKKRKSGVRKFSLWEERYKKLVFTRVVPKVLPPIFLKIEKWC